MIAKAAPATTNTAAQWPSVSVVVPTRDRFELVRRAVESVVGQRYGGSIECVVVYDGEQPAVPMLPSRPDRNVRVVRNNRTPGPAGARNAGALEARGEYLAFCDDDDEWRPDKLRRQIARLRADSDAIAVCCGIEVDSGRRAVTRVSGRDHVVARDHLRSRRPDLHTSTIVVRRDVFFDRVGTLDEDTPASYGEDYDWLLRAARAGRIATVREPLVRVAYHAGSYFDGRWRTIIAAERYLLAKHPELAREPKGLARIYGKLAFAYAALGETSEFRAWARRAFGLSPLQPRTYLAALVAAGVRAETLVRLLQRFGRDV